MAGTPAQAAKAVAEDVAATARNLSRHPNAVRWFSATAMLTIVLAFTYLVLRIEKVSPAGMSVEQFTAAVAARDAAIKPSTDPQVALLSAAVESVRAELASLRAEVKAGADRAREDRVALESKVDEQAKRTDRALEILVELSARK